MSIDRLNKHQLLPPCTQSVQVALALMLFALPTQAADGANALRRGRVRAGVWAGGAVMTGSLKFNAESAQVGTRIDALPSLQFGLDLWPDEQAGVYARIDLGTGAEITFPAGQNLSFNAQHFEAGGRYRWYFSPRADAFALVMGVGLRAIRQDAQLQQPEFLVDSLVAGPELNFGIEWPILGERLWIRALARGGLPFFVRESESDSGDPQNFIAIGAHLATIIQISGAWNLQLTADLVDHSIEYAGTGTRAYGVKDASSQDQLLTYGLTLRYAL